ncbi:MAG: 2-hydroxyacyl-CoA dehydratase family protein, partial [Lentisphaerota bacterium]
MAGNERLDTLKTEAAKAMYQQTLAAVPDISRRRPFVFSVDTQLFPELSIAGSLPVDSLILLGGFGVGGPQNKINAKIDQITEFGIDSRACNAVRMAQYNVLNDLLPIPDALVLTNSACDGMNALSRLVESHKPWSNVPRFIVNIPYATEMDDFTYLAGQFRELSSFLAGVSGRPENPQALREICEESNKQLGLMLELQEFKRAKPLPLDVNILNLAWALKCWISTITPSLYPWITSWLERALEAGEDFYRSGIGRDGVNEKIRYLWYDAQPVWSSELFTRLEQEFGAVCVSNYYATYYDIPLDLSSEESIYCSAAKKYVLGTPMIRQSLHSADLYVQDMLQAVKEYKCDAVLL